MCPICDKYIKIDEKDISKVVMVVVRKRTADALNGGVCLFCRYIKFKKEMESNEKEVPPKEAK